MNQLELGLRCHIETESRLQQSAAVVIPDIVLIGPIGAGKSTVGALLASRLGVPQVSSDDLCWEYYEELGFRRGTAERGPDGMIASRCNVHAVERLLEDHRNCVIDLGAGHSVYRDDESLTRVRDLLAPYPNVFLLLPAPDLEECSRVLRERNAGNEWLAGFIRERGYDPNEHFLRHPSNALLARSVIYTGGRTPAETADAILARVRGVGSGMRYEGGGERDEGGGEKEEG